MTVLPGSLDYLYYGGVLDYIPYEAYQTTPIANNNQNYNTVSENNTNNVNGIGTPNINYNHLSQDIYSPQNTSELQDAYNSEDINNARNSKKLNMSNCKKGLIGGAALLLTLIAILKGGGKSSKKAAAKTGILAKLNPKNWFKKANN